jgi:hypothetical protein
VARQAASRHAAGRLLQRQLLVVLVHRLAGVDLCGCVQICTADKAATAAAMTCRTHVKQKNSGRKGSK